MDWYNKYYINNINLNHIYNDDFKKTITLKLKNKLSQKNIEFKIDSIENEYLDKLKKLELLNNNKTSISQIEKNNSLIIIQKELEIIKLLSKYTLQNTNLNYSFFMSSLNTLLSFSEILKKRLNQNNFSLEKSKFTEGITRCSYKFCSYKHNCNYNYNYNKYSKNKCYQDHYVHNMVSLDIKTIIEYINSLYNNNDTIEDDTLKTIDSSSKLILHNKEILKTINTLNYVISHMETELKNKCLYMNENTWEQFHYVNNNK